MEYVVGLLLIWHLLLLIYELYYHWTDDIRKKIKFDIGKWTFEDSCFFKECRDRRWLFGKKYEVVILGLVLKIVQGWPYTKWCKINCPRIVAKKLCKIFNILIPQKKLLLEFPKSQMHYIRICSYLHVQILVFGVNNV